VNRFQEVYGWTPSYRLDSKKHAQKECNWILLSYQDSKPVCLWISGKTVTTIQCAIDERLFGDTIFQVDYSNGTYFINDIFLYNSWCIFRDTTLEQRSNWLDSLMTFFYEVPDVPSFKKLTGTRVRKSDIPDVYLIPEGYVQVPDIETSEYLRSLGDSFNIELEERDGLWFIKYPCLK
jgi:hypothetical protein